MTTRIKLQTCFSLEHFDSDLVELPELVQTVAELLKYMGDVMQAEFIDPKSGETEFDLEIRLNDKEIWFYPQGLNTRLESEDIVEINPLPLGGG